MRPHFALSAPDTNKYATELSLSTRTDWLAILATADSKGKLPQLDDTELNLQLFAEVAKELNCFDKPYSFYSDHARYTYFNREHWEVSNEAHNDTRCSVVLMSGLPGAGKNHWIAQNLPDIPQISLDTIRRDLKIKPTNDQAEVIRVAQQQAKDLLGQSKNFVWNATNVSSLQRLRTMRLFKRYNAEIEIVYVETDYENLLKQNANRSDPVPEKIIDKLMDNWDLPLLTEAHKVTYVVNNQTVSFPDFLHKEEK